MRRAIAGLALVIVWAIFSQVNLASAVAAQVTEYYHKVVKNDTMWGISKRYYKNPYKWHKLYRQNRVVYNPNLIFPGQFLLIGIKVSLKNSVNEHRNSEIKMKKKLFFNVDRSEFILKRQIAGTVEATMNLKLSNAVIHLMSHETLKRGEVITLVQKVAVSLPTMYTVVKPIGYAKVINRHSASVNKLFEEISGKIYFVLGKREPVKIVQSNMRPETIDVVSYEPLSVFTNSTVWGRVVGERNIIGERVALKRGLTSVLDGIVTSQTDNIIGITVKAPMAIYRNGIYEISK